MNFKNDFIEYKCLLCNKNCLKIFDKKLKEQFLNTYTYSNHDSNRFIILLQKGFYPFEYMNDWEKFSET